MRADWPLLKPGLPGRRRPLPPLALLLLLPLLLGADDDAPADGPIVLVAAAAAAAGLPLLLLLMLPLPPAPLLLLEGPGPEATSEMICVRGRRGTAGLARRWIALLLTPLELGQGARTSGLRGGESLTVKSTGKRPAGGPRRLAPV